MIFVQTIVRECSLPPTHPPCPPFFFCTLGLLLSIPLTGIYRTKHQRKTVERKRNPSPPLFINEERFPSIQPQSTTINHNRKKALLHGKTKGKLASAPLVSPTHPTPHLPHVFFFDTTAPQFRMLPYYRTLNNNHLTKMVRAAYISARFFAVVAAIGSLTLSTLVSAVVDAGTGCICPLGNGEVYVDHCSHCTAADVSWLQRW